MYSLVTNISNLIEINENQVKSVVNLLESGNTVPFIARYRKEYTGGLDEVQIRNIETTLDYLIKLNNRKEEVINLINNQGKLTEKLKNEINNCKKLQEIEDIYLPYKQKRKTKATASIEKGLEPLADIIMSKSNPEKEAIKFINTEKEVNNIEEALLGAMDIVIDRISIEANTRKYIREYCLNNGIIATKLKKEKSKDKSDDNVDNNKSEFKLYDDYNEKIATIKSHRILAINRGEKQKKLTVKMQFPDDIIIEYLKNYWIYNNKSNYNEYLNKSITEAYKKFLYPSVVREIRSLLTEEAENKAIEVFAENLEKLIMQKPVRNKIIMGIDPGIRTGSKIVIIDKKGDLVYNDLIYQEKREESINKLIKLCDKYKVNLIVIGNGTASREVESLVSNMISSKNNYKETIQYAIVSEAGASVYSASDIAREEFPNLDITVRGAISIARRILDPLSEFVKIDPKSIGVGQYQHDVNQTKLKGELYKVVESCVNKVGVNLNTASYSILSYVSGIGSSMAKKIVKYRKENGIIKSRNKLLDIPGLGSKTFEQCAGFLKIPESDNLLDNTWVHPENYEQAKLVYEKLKDNQKINIKELSQKLSIGEMTLKDIVESLQKPNLDPRDELNAPLLRTDILDINNITENMVLEGTVRNVVDFGAFIDIGLKNDALCHISEMSNTFVENPRDIMAVGDIIKVRVISIDKDRNRIGVSAKL